MADTSSNQITLPPISYADLSVGDNTITVWAADGSGNGSSTSINVVKEAENVVAPIFKTIQSTDATSIDLQGYSGINKVSVEGTGGKYALSFDKGVTWKSKVVTGYVASKDPLLLGITVTDDGHRSSGDAINMLLAIGNNWDISGPGCATYTLSTAKIVSQYSLGVQSLDWGLKSWRVLGSNDGGVVWDTLDIKVNRPDLVGVHPSYKLITFSSTKAYKMYRLCADTSSSGSIMLITNWRLYESVPAYEWQTIQTSAVPTKGMTPELLSSLTSADYAPIFQRTQLDFYAYLAETDTLTKLIVDLPENAGPAISNFKASTTVTHSTDVVISADIDDLELDSVQYQVNIDGQLYKDWSELVANPLALSLTIPYSVFTMSGTDTSTTHEITLYAKDARGVVTTTTPIIIERVNTAPILTVLDVNAKALRATIGDPENDEVSYRIYVNDVEVLPWTAFTKSPASVDYRFNRNVFKWVPYASQNKVTLEYKDIIGRGGKQDMFFLAEYTGLLFMDESDNLLNDDNGGILLRPDLGTHTAGTHGSINQLKLKNQTGLAIKNVLISMDKSSYPLHTFVKLSSNGDVFEDLDVVSSAAVLNSGEALDFFVQASSDADATSGSIIKINASCKLV